MKIYSWNVNGIRAVIRKGALQQFVADHDPDILAIQETKAQEGQAEIDMPQYTEYWNSAVKKGYSGTAIFTKSKPLSIDNGLPVKLEKQFGLIDGYGDPNKEGRIVTAEYDNFYLVTVYTPNSKGDLSRLPLREKNWDPAFLAYLKILEQHKPVVFCGDLNVAHQEIDLHDPVRNKGKHGFTDEERAGFQKFLDAGFIDTFRHLNKESGNYTWWTAWANARARNLGWRIDYFLVSSALKDNVKAANIHPEVMGSDHCPISIELEF